GCLLVPTAATSSCDAAGEERSWTPAALVGGRALLLAGAAHQLWPRRFRLSNQLTGRFKPTVGWV
ncbi:hypothetical protein CF641_38450, partial [Burkholderia pseudomallei]